MEANEVLDTSAAIGKEEGKITLFTALEYPVSLRKFFTIILPEPHDYTKAMEIALKLSDKGQLIGAVDILISAMCLNRDVTVVTQDEDFKTVKEFYPELKIKS